MLLISTSEWQSLCRRHGGLARPSESWGRRLQPSPRRQSSSHSWSGGDPGWAIAAYTRPIGKSGMTELNTRNPFCCTEQWGPQISYTHLTMYIDKLQFINYYSWGRKCNWRNWWIEMQNNLFYQWGSTLIESSKGWNSFVLIYFN